MDIMAWTDDYAIQIPAIDSEHRLLLTMLNDVERLAEQPSPLQTSLVSAALDNLVNAVKRHFASEEQFLAAIGFPDLDRHRTEHAQLGNQMDRFCRTVKRGEQQIDERLLLFLRDWYLRHIILHDSRIGSYCREHGITAPPDQG